MDRHHEKLQFLGIYGIFRETIKLIHTGTTIFSQITLAFILPLALAIFAHSEISSLLLKSHQWRLEIDALLFNLACFFFSAVFFFSSTAAAVYAAACIHADRGVSFIQLLRVAPKVCKQHLLTFLCLIVDFFAFNFVALSAILLIWIAIYLLLYLLLNYDPNEFLVQFLILVLSAEAWYFALIWQLSSVVAVFEPDSYGFEAIARSKELLRGKMAVAAILLILIGLPFGAMLLVIRGMDVRSGAIGVGIRGILGVIWILWFLMFLLIGTVLYFVGKSYHREKIDKSALSDHLGGYLPVDCDSLKVEDDDDLENR